MSVRVRPRVVGAVNVRPRYVGAPAQRVQSVNEEAIEYEPEQYVAGNLTWMGLGQTVIPAGSPGTAIPIRPIRPITPQKLFCPSTVVGLLLLEANIGGVNLFAGSAGVPIELFSEVSTSPQIDWMTLDPAVGIEFVVGNPTAGALTFSGALYGTSVRR